VFAFISLFLAWIVCFRFLFTVFSLVSLFLVLFHCFLALLHCFRCRLTVHGLVCLLVGWTEPRGEDRETERVGGRSTARKLEQYLNSSEVLPSR
jgi:hypothetical protein